VNQDPSDTLPLAPDDVAAQTTVSAPDTGSPSPHAKVVLTGEEIRERMAIIRLQIDERRDEMVGQVTALSDWRSYVRRHPWVSVTAAAALGYVLVPSRKIPGAEDSTRDVNRQPAAFTTDELRSVLIGAAKRAATAYASKSLGAVVASFLAADDTARPATEGDHNES